MIFAVLVRERKENEKRHSGLMGGQEWKGKEEDKKEKEAM